MAAVDMRMPSTWLEPFRQLDPDVLGQLLRAGALLASTAAVAVAVPVALLVRYDGHAVSQVWITGITLCTYAFLLLLCIRRSWPFYVDLACLSYGLLLAAAAAHAGPRAAIYALHLATAYAATHLGYALALHRLCAGARRAIGGTEAEARAIALIAIVSTAAFTTLLVALRGHPLAMDDGDEMVTVSSLSFIVSMPVAVWLLLVVQEQWMALSLGACLIVSFLISVAPGAGALLEWLLMVALIALLAFHIAYVHASAAAAAADEKKDD